MHRLFQLAEKSGTHHGILGCGGQTRPAGHAVVEVVENQRGQVDVAPVGRQHMGPADAQNPSPAITKCPLSSEGFAINRGKFETMHTATPSFMVEFQIVKIN